VCKIQATFNLHSKTKYGFHSTGFNVTHNCIMTLSADLLRWVKILTYSLTDLRFMQCSNILYDDPFLGKIKPGLIFTFRRCPARMRWTEIEYFIWELSVRSPCNMPCRHRRRVEVKLYSFLTSVLNGGWRSKHLSDRLVLGKGSRYPLYRLGGHDSWSERVWRRENLLPPPDFKPQPCSPQQFTRPSTNSRHSSFSSGPKYRLSLKLLWTARWNKPILILRITHIKYLKYS
jgi:hypothetical protein